MAFFPTPFGNPSGNKNINYDFVDIASGTGFIKYLGYGTEDSGGESKHLSSSVSYSEEPAQQATFSTAGVKINSDFDIEFQTTQTARGTAIITFGVTITGTRTFTDEWTADIIHYDGSTETIIGTATTASIVYSGSSLQFDFVMAISLTQKSFKKGDILRLTMRDNVTSVGGSGTAQISLYHDPTDTAVSGLQTTKLILDMPFRIDL